MRPSAKIEEKPPKTAENDDMSLENHRGCIFCHGDASSRSLGLVLVYFGRKVRASTWRVRACVRFLGHISLLSASRAHAGRL